MIQHDSFTEPVFQVLVSRRYVVRQDSPTLVYRVECFLSLPLDQLVTLSSSHFTIGKIARECNTTFERYRNNLGKNHSIGYYKEYIECNSYGTAQMQLDTRMRVSS